MNILKEFNKLNKENYFLITSDNIKEKVIKLKTEQEIKKGIIYQFKIISVSEFISLTTFNVDNDIYLDDQPISLIKEKIKFSKFNLNKQNEYLNTFKSNNKKFININKTFIKNMNKYSFFVLGCDVYLKPIFEFYNISYQTITIKEHNKEISFKKFLNKEEEIFYLFEEISKDLKKGISIDKIYVANADESYYGELIKHATFYNIPIDYNVSVSLYDISFIKELLSLDYNSLINLLKNTNKLNERFKHIKDIDALHFDNLINELITIINKYSNNYKKENLMKAIIEDAKNKAINETYLEAIKFIEVDEILTLKEDEIAYIVNARYEAFPQITKNNDLLTDNDKKVINYPTSSIVNEAYNKYYKNIINSKNIKYISFSLKDNYNEYEPSDIVNSYLQDDFSFSETKLKDIKEGFSKEYYKKHFSSQENGSLLTTFTGAFSLKEEERTLMRSYLKDLNLKLSPSTVTSYIRAPFIYYVERILKISTFQENISLYLGNFFHLIVEVFFTIRFNNIISKKETYHRNEQLNELIINYINQEINNSNIDLEVFYKDFHDLYFKTLFTKDTALEVQTLFFIKKNQDNFIDSLKLLVHKILNEPTKNIFLEKVIKTDKVNSKADLVQLYNDNTFSIIDFKSGNKTAFTYSKAEELLEDLINNKDVDLNNLDLIQPLFYSLYLKEMNSDYKFRDVSFYSFFNDNPKLNALMIEELNRDYYTRGKTRLITKEELTEIEEKLKVIFKRVMKNILEADFKVEVMKDKNNKLNLETKWYSVYEPVAFFSKNDLEEDNDEKLFS